MQKTKTCTELNAALEHLSPGCRFAVCSKIAKLSLPHQSISEIRLRLGRNTVICTAKNKIKCDHTSCAHELRTTLRSLCMGAVYAYQNTIKNGYIPMQHGGRAGVVGVISDSNTSVDPETVTSINIRIPHHIRGISSAVYDLFVNDRNGIIIYSPPAGGKTTLLRDLAIELSRGDKPLNVALVDTRRELDNGRLPSDCMIDSYSGYPKSLAVEIAARTMGSEVIICDEVGYEEVQALKFTAVSGIPVIASAHARDLDELRSRHDIRELIDIGVFEYAVGISRDGVGEKQVFVIDRIGGC